MVFVEYDRPATVTSYGTSGLRFRFSPNALRLASIGRKAYVYQDGERLVYSGSPVAGAVEVTITGGNAPIPAEFSSGYSPGDIVRRLYCPSKELLAIKRKL